MKKSFFLAALALLISFTACKPKEEPTIDPTEQEQEQEQEEQPKVPDKLFTVGDGVRVQFAPGNLQYRPSTKTWRFAKHQYDVIGEDNAEISDYSYNGWIDLFGWNTSKRPTLYTMDGQEYAESEFTDWGANEIGTFPANTWRTLKRDEWGYLLQYRRDAESLYMFATVNGVNGVIILPDNTKSPFAVEGEDNNESSYVYSAAEWEKFEEVGAIFLPEAGLRTGTDAWGVSVFGKYWSSTLCEDKNLEAFILDIYDENGSIDYYETQRFYYGISVRLARTTKKYIDIPQDDSQDEPIVEGGIKTVDLGLSSDVLWADMNVGANAPEQYGDFFAWGEVKTKSEYSEDTYTYQHDMELSDVLFPRNDAANCNIGKKWHMPSQQNMQELVDECTWTWHELNGQAGALVTGPNGNSIFLPANGYMEGTFCQDKDVSGHYWSSTINDDQTSFELYFYRENDQVVAGVAESVWTDGGCVRAIVYPE